MNVNDILQFVAQVFFVALSAVAIFDYLQHRNSRRRDFALLSLSLGLPLGITLLTNLFGLRLALLDLLGALALFSQPYFLFRLLHYYRPVRTWIHWAVVLGMVACWVILFVYIGQYPATTQVIIFGYCVIVDAYCTWAYSRGISSTVGILRRRLLYITISSGLFTLALAGNVFNAIVPEMRQSISAIGLAITAISAVLYYLAFLPPRWLRHAWQFEGLRDFLLRANSQNGQGISAEESFRLLTSAAIQAVNGALAAVVQWDEEAGEWKIRDANDAALAATALASGRRLIEQAWQQRTPFSVHVPDLQDAEERRQLAAVGARTWLLVPITGAARIWAILIVTLRDRSLFIDDDLTLLELFAQQCAILLENNRLVSVLQGYSEELERKVEARTKELQESENALRELNATLEQRVEQRTQELQRSNAELDQFAYVASHDLKAPLRAITHLATWIAEDAGDVLPSASQEHLSKLKARVRRMEVLLDDLLAYSRVGRQRHLLEMVDIGELIQDVTELVSPPPGFQVNICGNLPVIEVERTPLELVFRNLISNAIKHHHHASNGVVEICADSYADGNDAAAYEEGGLIKFSVKDNGPGIAPEFHQRIFDIFQTLLPRDQVEGSGIGLALVKKSVESRGGNIWVESTPGEGTTFHFTWPYHGRLQEDHLQKVQTQDGHLQDGQSE